MNKPKCCVCGKGPDKTPLYRVNGIGVLPAVWACKKHALNPEPDLVELVEIIAKG